MDYFEKLKEYTLAGKIPEALGEVIRNFFLSYNVVIQENGTSLQLVQSLMNRFLDLVAEQLQHPFQFEAYHQRILEPFDYYHFGLEFFRPLVLLKGSTVKGTAHLDAMETALGKEENVILLGNHQTEPDPQAISLLLEKSHPRLAEEMIFLAGHRVISDPLAVPLSKGRNLLCIYSKRHVENPPEQKQEKLLHNQRTLKKMGQLLDEGGKCIYVAPSGGRDRPGPSGEIEVAPFDPQSLEMFCLIARNAARPVHFYPLALATYALLPPPRGIGNELGERRHAHSAPIHLSFGAEIDMENFPGCDAMDKKERRQKRAEYVWSLVARDYKHLSDNEENEESEESEEGI